MNGLLHSIKYQLKQADLTNVTSEEGDKLFREHMVEKFQSEDLERIEFPKPDEDMPKSVQEERQKDLSQEYESIEADLSEHATDDDSGFNCIHFSDCCVEKAHHTTI